MAKAGKPGQKPKSKLTKKEQAERFKQTARELGCDESPSALNDAFGQINPLRADAHKKA
jgi:hypothetical protein